MAIVERFCEPGASGDGKDPNGFALPDDGSYDDTGHGDGDYRLERSGSFSGYTHGTDPPYIYLDNGSGITPGLYTIASKVSNDVILLTSSAGSDSSDVGSSTGAWDLDDAATNLSAGQRLNIRGSFSGYGSDITFANNGTAINPIVIRGYGADSPPTIGDGGNADIDMGAYTLIFSGDLYLVEGLEVTGTDLSYTVRSAGTQNLFYRCKMKNTNTGSVSTCEGLFLQDGVAVNCWFSSAGTGTSTALLLFRAAAIGCYVESTCHGIWLNCSSGRSNMVCNCIIKGNSTAGKHAINVENADTLGDNLVIVSNFAYNFDDMIQFTVMPEAGDTGLPIIVNNLAHTMIGYGLETADTEDWTIVCIGNASYNTADDSSFLSSNFGDLIDFNHVECTVDPCVDASGGDYSLNNTAGGGALLRGAAVWNDVQGLFS